MNVFINSGKTIRLGRILNPQTQRAAVIAFDHGVHLGAIPGMINPAEMLESLAEGGADAFLVGPGITRHYAHIFSGRGAPGCESGCRKSVSIVDARIPDRPNS